MNCVGRCYFCQTGNCILSKKMCSVCSTHIEKISDKLSIKDHLDYVVNRNRFRMNMVVSIVSMCIAILVLYIKFNELPH